MTIDSWFSNYVSENINIDSGRLQKLIEFFG